MVTMYIGVVSGCCCKEVIYMYILTIINNFPYSTCISFFFGSSIPTSLFIFKMFFRSYIYISWFQISPKQYICLQPRELWFIIKQGSTTNLERSLLKEKRFAQMGFEENCSS